MPYFVFEVVHACNAISEGPSASAVTATMRDAALPAASNAGGWVGTRPRITRQASASITILNPLATGQFQMNAVWVYRIPDGQSEVRQRAILAAVLDRINLSLARIQGLGGEWGTTVYVPYAEAINGPIWWWESSEAARTATEERYPTWTTDAPENPRGPEGPLTHPTTPAETLSHLGDGAAAAAEKTRQLLIALGVVGAVGLFIYGAWVTRPLVQMEVDRRRAPPPPRATLAP